MSRTQFLTILLLGALLAMLGVSYTGYEQGLTDMLSVYQGIAWGLGSTAVAAWLAYLLDTYLFSHVETWSEIESGNTAMAIWASSVFVVIVLSMTLVQMSVGQPRTGGVQAVVDTAAADLGKTEVPPGSNAGPLPEKCLAHVGLSEGYPYCAACVSLWTSEAAPGYPAEAGDPINSAATRDFRDADCAVKVGPVLRGNVRPDSGAVIVWQKGNGPYGHAGVLVEMVGTRCFRSIEANTSPGREGPQRDGQGVYKRLRCFQPSSYFRVVRIVLSDCQHSGHA